MKHAICDRGARYGRGLHAWLVEGRQGWAEGPQCCTPPVPLHRQPGPGCRDPGAAGPQAHLCAGCSPLVLSGQEVGCAHGPVQGAQRRLPGGVVEPLWASRRRRRSRRCPPGRLRCSRRPGCQRTGAPGWQKGCHPRGLHRKEGLVRAADRGLLALGCSWMRPPHPKAGAALIRDALDSRGEVCPASGPTCRSRARSAGLGRWPASRHRACKLQPGAWGVCRAGGHHASWRPGRSSKVSSAAALGSRNAGAEQERRSPGSRAARHS